MEVRGQKTPILRRHYCHKAVDDIKDFPLHEPQRLDERILILNSNMKIINVIFSQICSYILYNGFTIVVKNEQVPSLFIHILKNSLALTLKRLDYVFKLRLKHHNNYTYLRMQIDQSCLFTVSN